MVDLFVIPYLIVLKMVDGQNMRALFLMMVVQIL